MVKYQLLSAYFLQSQIAEMAQMDCAGGRNDVGQNNIVSEGNEWWKGENSCALQSGKTKDWFQVVVTRYIAPCHVKWLWWSAGDQADHNKPLTLQLLGGHWSAWNINNIELFDISQYS